MNEIVVKWLGGWGVTFNSFPWLYWVLVFTLMGLAVYLGMFICRHILIPLVRKLTTKTSTSWDDIILSDTILNDLSRLLPPILIAFLLPMIFAEGHPLLELLLRVDIIYLVVVVAKLVCSFLSSVYELSSSQDRFKNHHLRGVYQMLKILVVCVALIVIVSILIDKNPGYILTALGASAAVLMLVFKDMIMGLVAGVQLSANDMLRPGDWISMPKYGADGDVIEVTLSTVKVRNWDNTTVTVPPYTLVSDSFQNWRGMFESGGRRIKRSINIDMTSVRFCTTSEIELYRQKGIINDDDTIEELTNITLLRRSLMKYLKSNPKVNQDLMVMVRQLQPTPHGMPLELYFFSADKQWVAYETLQADVFDYVMALVPSFGLKVFQSPMGEDLRGIKN